MSEGLDLTAAVEAAAKALYDATRVDGTDDWPDVEIEHCAFWLAASKASMAAAAPLIEAAVREQVAREIEDAGRRRDGDGGTFVALTFRESARIARGPKL